MATANDTSRPIPGLDDLLFNNLRTFADPERAQQAAYNVGYPIRHGIGAIGDLLWAAAQDPDNNPIDPRTLGDIGCLLKHLAEVDDTMHHIEVNAAIQCGEARAKADSEFVDIPVIGRAR